VYWRLRQDVAYIVRVCTSISGLRCNHEWEARAQRDMSLERDLHWCMRRYQRWLIQLEAAEEWRLLSYMQKRSMKRYAVKVDSILLDMGLKRFISSKWDLSKKLRIEGFGGKNLWGKDAPRYEESPRNRSAAKLKSKGSSIQDSRDLLDEFMVHVETLREMGHDFGDGIVNAHPIRQMKSKLWPDCVTQWNRWVSAQGWPKTRYPTIIEFIEFMDQELKDQATAQSRKADHSKGSSKGHGTTLFQSKPANGGKDKPARAPQTRGWGSSNAAPNRNAGAGGGRKPVKLTKPANTKASQSKTEWGPGQCAFCGQRASSHRPVDCAAGKKLTAKEKRRYLKHGCWRCLQLGHRKGPGPYLWRTRMPNGPP